MKKLIALVLFALPLFAADPPTISVSGTGNVKVVPDRVSFTIGVRTEKPTVREAYAENNTRTQRVIDALKRAGVKPEETQTSNFSIDTPYDDQGRRRPVFVVANNVTVIREDPKNVSDLLQAAIDAGANEAHSLRFFVADPTAARDRALEKAYRDARGRAEKLAAVAGKSLGDPITINTVSTTPPHFAQNVMNEAVQLRQSVPIETGVTDLVYTVTVTFALK